MSESECDDNSESEEWLSGSGSESEDNCDYASDDFDMSCSEDGNSDMSDCDDCDEDHQAIAD